jgi:cytochrome c-type biogenesis protein CcmH
MNGMRGGCAGVLTVLLCALAPDSTLAALAEDTVADTVLESRVNQVSAELRCLVCQNQTLADSHAGLAVDLKNQVREQLRAGRSEQQVIDYMTERYGDFVRYRPPFKASTWLLWLGPALLVVVGLAGLWRALGRHARPQGAVPQPGTADEAHSPAARAQELLGGREP